MLRRLIVVTTMGLAGCSLFFPADDLGNETPPPGPSDAGAEAAVEAAADAGAEEASTTNGCPSREGPVMVRIDDFCIDSTEVTRAQYAKFVAAVGPNAMLPANAKMCSTVNKELGPLDPEKAFPPRKEGPDYPVRLVDWCDAKAYCQWAGKDLCGGLGGNKLGPKDAADPSKSQWAKACSANGAKRFAYGDSHVAGLCMEGTNQSQPKNTKCEGGYPGLFDMVGNVAEWIDACQDDPATNCALMGLAPDREVSSCTWVDVPPGDIPWNSAGIRCCAKAE